MVIVIRAYFCLFVEKVTIMAQLQSGKYNVAWFKLAEFVSRKEKERALGIYRLLAYSLPDEGLARQLEGDLLLSFDDEKAAEAYVKAALLYERSGKLIHAAAVYEHLVSLYPFNPDYSYKLVKLHLMLECPIKKVKSLSLLARVLMRQNKLAEIEYIFADRPLLLEHRLILYNHCIEIVFQKNGTFDKTAILKTIVKDLVNHDEYLESFMKQLSSVSVDLYECALGLLSKSL